jgi:hypothetical protein
VHDRGQHEGDLYPRDFNASCAVPEDVAIVVAKTAVGDEANPSHPLETTRPVTGSVPMHHRQLPPTATIPIRRLPEFENAISFPFAAQAGAVGLPHEAAAAQIRRALPVRTLTRRPR